MESKLGPDHEVTLATRNSLANAYENAGMAAEAVAMHELSHKHTESKFGPHHGNTLISLDNLARAY